jgi:hypothetical protein
MIPRSLLVVIILVNGVVLLGQVWPAGAPPFARMVNIIFLVTTLIVFGVLFARTRRVK